MKLLFCTRCFDVRKLRRTATECGCGYVRARYLEDGWHAAWNGKGHLFGLDNHTVRRAMDEADLGVVNPRLDAWLMNDNPRVHIMEEIDGQEGQEAEEGLAASA